MSTAAPPAIVDIAANLTAPAFRSDRGAVLIRARAAGVAALVVPGANVAESERAVALAHAHPDYLWCTVGVHPHHASTCDGATVPALRALARDAAVRAIGECGLDFFRDLSPRPVQEEAFTAQMALAAELALPLYMHERDASARFLDLVREWRPRVPRGVVHCFTGDGDALRAYLDLDLHIGITGWICDERRGTHLQSLVRLVPAARLMIETDAPYLLPRTLRPRPKDGRNEPAFLPAVLAMVAACRGEEPAVTAASTTAVARAFFARTAEGTS